MSSHQTLQAMDSSSLSVKIRVVFCGSSSTYIRTRSGKVFLFTMDGNEA